MPKCTDEPLRVAIVGAGDMGGVHARAWKESGAGRVVAVADVDEARLEAFRAAHGVEDAATDYNELIDRVRPDAVSVCVPAFLHPAVTLHAAKAGCHVLCEKPIALTAEDGRSMIDACRSAGAKLAVAFQRRYDPLTRAVRDLVERDVLGRPLVWRSLDLREVRPKTRMHETTLGNGGPVVDCGVHWFDQWAVVFGSEAVSVTARGGFRFGRGKQRLAAVQELAVDTAVVTVEYASGDVGELTICWGLPEGTAATSDETLFGPHGVARKTESGLQVLSGEHKEEHPLDGDPRPALMRDFAAAVRANDAPPITGEDGLAALQVSLAALVSAEERRPVDPRDQ